ncbi:MAG: electron transport complex subunit RsxA [Elusimicrobia bacterium]|nr:electron transport complex subunit RsxA [Elusimicrobiota bacterium]MBD3412450.1 electron transport complex subunit RsxA [Elusimicrobiota bacterium]
MELFLIFFSAMLVNNIILIRFLGLCPFFGVSNKLETSISMGFAVIFVMTLATAVSWNVYHLILVPLNLIYLRTAFFILIIASLVQLVEMFMKKVSPTLYRALGIYLPLITTNCGILAVAFLDIDYGYSFVQGVIFALGAALGFVIAIVVFASLREQLEDAPVPESFKGYPISFVLASLLSLAFMGFAGMFGLQI